MAEISGTSTSEYARLGDLLSETLDSGKDVGASVSVTVEGEVARPGVIPLEDFLRPHPLEERIYRLRCVEAWSMVIPWVGIPLGDVIRRLEPATADHLIEGGVIAGGMIPKVRGAVDAAARSGCPVVIGGWSDPAVLADPLADTTVATIVLPPIGSPVVETCSTAFHAPHQKSP